MRITIVGLAVICVQAAVPGVHGAEPAFQAGVAARNITPAEFMWMAGYAARTRPAEGKEHDLFVKALALDDGTDRPFVVVTSDLIGLPRSLSDQVAEELRQKAGLPRERLLLTASHTHCGPVVRDNLADMYPMPPEEAARIAPYTQKLQQAIVEVVRAALADRKPARLAIGQGTARFAVNRRQPTAKGIINGNNPQGPVDHDVPVLRVEGMDGQLRAVVFGYACHNTTLQYYRWCGDYAGFAQLALERKHPGAVALFWAGCGGDANPLPRGTVELAQKYGQELADAVEAVLQRPMTPLATPWSARYARIALPLGELPSRDKLAADALSKNLALRNRALRLLKVLDAGGKLDDHYPHYPVQVWRLGGLVWISLGGEVVVDYSHRLKKELKDQPAVWVTAYANDVMAYIPSARVLKEGGYEAGRTHQNLPIFRSVMQQSSRPQVAPVISRPIQWPSFPRPSRNRALTYVCHLETYLCHD